MKVFDILPKVVQWESIEYAPDFICPECGKSAIKGKNLYMQPVLEKPDLVGWCETNNGYMAVFECPCCHSKYRFHPHMTLFDADQFDFYLGAYYINQGETEWIANAKELYEKLEKSK
jgi:hypothetical protein